MSDYKKVYASQGRAIVFVDRQPQMLFGVGKMPPPRKQGASLFAAYAISLIADWTGFVLDDQIPFGIALPLTGGVTLEHRYEVLRA